MPGYGPHHNPPTYTGGALSRFSPPYSYWDTSVPRGLTGFPRAKNWTNPSEWRVHAYHPASWGNWGFEVDSFDAGANSTLRFGRGGNQEARGGNGMGARFFAGMVEELDSPNEFYHDVHGHKLYWSPPSSMQQSPPASGLVVPRLARLIEVVGSSVSSPAHNITITGLTLAHTVPTFCCEFPYESVSGGDWSIHRWPRSPLTLNPNPKSEP